MGKFPQLWVLLSDTRVPEFFGKKSLTVFLKKGKLEKQIVIISIISERQAIFFSTSQTRLALVLML